MIYKEIKPSENLKDLIKYHWIMIVPNDYDPEKTHICPPDACISLIFFKAFDYPSEDKVFLSAIGYNFNQPKLVPNSIFIGVKFKPGTYISVFPHPIEKILKSEIIISSSGFNQIINEIDQDFNKFNDIENEIIINMQPISDDRSVLIADKIDEHRGNISLKDIAANNNLSVRQCQRIFKKSIGISLVFFSQIIRMRKVIDNLIFTNNNFINIAIDNGYFDQSHMIHELKKHSGYTPNQIRMYFQDWHVETFRKFE